MLITLLAIGSRGDTQPYIALGLALKNAGHTTRLAAFENYESFIKSYGLEFFPIKGDVSLVANSDAAENARQADNPLKVLLSFNELKRLAANLQKNLFDACAGSDAIVYHPGAALGYFAAREMNIPGILATPFPMTPTGEYPSVLFYNGPRFGPVYNRLTHQITQHILWMGGGPVKDFWKQQFGRLPADFGMPYPRQDTRRYPTIVSCSDCVFPTPRDWPKHVHNTGYWFIDAEPDWTPPADLLNFFDRGSPPVYVGFGSIGDPSAAAQTTDLVITALRMAGVRGVLATGWNGMSRLEHLPEDLFILDSAPHTWLFPRMAAVIHHGGAGTTAAGLRAGVPAIIIPHGNDQFAWGRRVYELGVGAPPIPRKKLTAENLAAAVRYALAEERCAAARSLGEKIQSERGAENAARVIEEAIL